MKKMILITTLALVAIPAFSQNQINPRTPVKPQIYSSTGLGDNVLAQIADGGGWQTVITLVNLRPSRVAFLLACVNDQNPTVGFPFIGIGTTYAIDGYVDGYSEYEISTQGTAAAVNQGYCALGAPGDTTTPGYDIAAFAIYSYAPTGQQVSVPASPKFLTNTLNSLIPAFDNRNGYQYGVALVDTNSTVTGNPGDTITWTVSTGGNQIASGSFTMQPEGHTAFILADAFPATAGIQGTITFQISQGAAGPQPGSLVGLGLRAAPWGALTSVDMFEPMTY